MPLIDGGTFTSDPEVLKVTLEEIPGFSDLDDKVMYIARNDLTQAWEGSEAFVTSIGIVDVTAVLTTGPTAEQHELLFEVTLRQAAELPDAAESAIAVSPAIVEPDGEAATLISVTLEDACGRVLVNRLVTLEQDGDAVIAAASAITNESGVATFTAVNETAEAVTFTATSDGIEIGPSNTVTFVGSGSEFLVECWEMNEASGDRVEAINGDNLTEAAGTVGTSGGAADFAADGNTLTLASNSRLQVGGGNFLVSCWLKTDLSSIDPAGIIGKWNVTDGREWLLFFGGSTDLTFYVKDAAFAAAFTETWDAAEWHLVACWLDVAAETINIKIDDDAAISEPFTSLPVASGTAPLVVGVNPDTGGETQLYDGLMKRVRLYKGFATADVAGICTTLWNAGSGTSCV